jgi:hypothetical protein
MSKCILFVALASVLTFETQGFKSNSHRVSIKQSSLSMVSNENALSVLAAKIKKSFIPIALGASINLKTVLLLFYNINVFSDKE